MSQDERICRNCGATIPPNERVCPSCGRLSIDRTSSRLGGTDSAYVVSKTQTKDLPIEEPATASSGEPVPPGSSPEPDSYYAVAPMPRPPDAPGTPTESKPKGCGCAIFLMVMTWLLTIAYVL
jgi:predicted RNA-binding Zn-ribbon protein involved in translation (DUF1610 family)